MSLSISHFTIEELESRFEMQTMTRQLCTTACTSEGGAAYGYYGSSWGNLGRGEGYTGIYQGDGSGNAQLDDGTYTDQSSGSFPAYAPLGVNFRCFCPGLSRCLF